MQLPTPEITELNRPYWDALGEGHLVFQRCGCGHAWLPARQECPACLQPSAVWTRASGRATLLSWVVYHVAYNEAFKDRLPYNVALVELTEGPRLISSVLAPLNELRGDAPLVLKIETEDGIALPRFQLERSPQ